MRIIVTWQGSTAGGERDRRSWQRRQVTGCHFMWFCLALSGMLLSGCTSNQEETADLRVEISTEPAPPTVGPAELSLRLRDAAGQPIENAEVRVEGNMNHAGMKPSFAEMSEGVSGEYIGTLDFTMGGDWFLLVNVTTADGKSLEHKIDVPGVRAE